MTKEQEGDFQQHLRHERLAQGWSQQEVADRIGTTPNTISRWELDMTTPGPYFRARLCKLFGKTEEELGLLRKRNTRTRTTSSPSPKTTHPVEEHVPFTWHVPYRRNPFFIGREDVLIRLREALHSERLTSLMQVHAISGLGGIGKTQVVLEYAYRYREEYQAVLWARADSHETLLAEIAALAESLGLPEKNESDQSRITRAVKRWFQQQTGWLLILDNVEDLEILDEVLPSLHSGHVLLTSRALATGTLARCIDLEPLNIEEGALLLLRRAKRIAPDAFLEGISLQDHERAREVAMTMGGLPLALDQAGAYLEETGCSLSGYLEHYRTQSTALLSIRGEAAHPDHPASVTMTFSLAIELVEQIQPAAAELLRCCSFLHPDAIPEEILLDGAEALGPLLQSTAPDPLALDGAIKVLLRFSLVRRNPDNRTLTIHRLVQRVLRDTMTEEVQRQWAERLVQAINGVFPHVGNGADLHIWPRCQRFLPQVYACAKLVEYWQLTLPEAARLLNQAGLYCIYRSQSAQAEALLKQVLDIRQKTLGEMHPDVADTLNHLALLYHQRGRYAQAEPLYQRALTILEKQLGPVHPRVAIGMQCLATCYHYQGKFVQVTPLYEQALAILEQTVGPIHPDVADNLNDLARLYREQGRGAEAEALYQRALALYQQSLGLSHPFGAICLTNMGLLYSEQGRKSEAEELLHRALHILEQSLGPDHPNVALSLNPLALLAGRRHRFAQGRILGQRALAIREKVYGPEHPLVAESLMTLGKLDALQGRSTQASSLFERALTILERAVSLAHPLVAQCFYDQAELLVQRGRYTEAEPFYQRALTIWEQALGCNHPRAVRCAKRCSDLQEYLRPEGNSRNNSSFADFLAECCDIHAQAWSRADDLWRTFLRWAEKRGAKAPLSRRAFAQELAAHGCHADRTKNYRLWRGVAVKLTWEDTHGDAIS